MMDSHDELLKDMEAVRQIPIVSTMLDVICQTTGMGFAAIARVTEDRWLACSVRDEVQFGLQEGGELKIETTLCNEIRHHRRPVIVDHVERDPQYRSHHTPRIYGLQSYISFPIILKDGTFFGTLCAIDSKPAELNNTKVIGMFTMFAELLAFHLQSSDLLERTHQAAIQLQYENKSLTNAKFGLDNFVYTASHDLKSPVNNIKGLLKALSDAVEKEPIDREDIGLIIGHMKSSVDRFAVTIKDLTAIAEADKDSMEGALDEVDLYEVVVNVKQDLYNPIAASNARIEVICDGSPVVHFPKKNFKSIIYNLLSNAIKYRSPERSLKVLVKLERVDGKVHLSIADNGIGVPSGSQDKIFTMFKRFHTHVEGSGLGLYIVKRMVDNANGQITVSSTLNEGTTFTIILADT